MRRRIFFGLLAVGVLATIAAACGRTISQIGVAAHPSPSPNPSPAGSAAPFTPQRPYAGPRVISFVVRPGADPAIVGRRIGGANAVVSPAYPPNHYEENLPRTIILRTFIVPVTPEDLQPALTRAQADPDVQLAHTGPPLGA